MVMVYPKEGSIARENCACIVDAPWVTADHKEAAELWRKYLREDEQQRSFMAAGFRPGTDLPVTDPISPRYGLTAAPPAKVIRPEYIDPAVTEEIMDSWEDVKRHAVVAFVVDTSASMHGQKLEDAKEGFVAAIDNMAQGNHVGLITFETTVTVATPVRSLDENRHALAAAIEAAEAKGSTALYDAVKAAIQMVDEAPGPTDAIRAIVVLTDGKKNAGSVCLDDVIEMSSTSERDIADFCGSETDVWALDVTRTQVAKDQLIGDSLRPELDTTHKVQIFFIGIGADADLNIGRLLAEATGAEFQGVTDEDFARLLEEFSKYF
jgi:Ca-activated chloride channel family protein